MTANAARAFPLRLLSGSFAVCRLLPDAAIPPWATQVGSSLWSLTRTPEELSIVCPEVAVPPGQADVERGFRAFQLIGPVPFTTTGVVAGLTAPLAAHGISVFILSTYDTDYLMVKGHALNKAVATLRAAGVEVR